MATTTNFGWETPDDTDLVKDGAAAIRTLGGAIDTSLVDLKGGTTGQILSKASNTDMDFTWTSPNPGDITGVTAGTGLTGGGTSGDVTVSIDPTYYLLANQTRRNPIINSNFSVWQRGTSISLAASSPAYTADRWYVYVGASQASTVSRQTTSDSTNLPNIQYCARFQRNSGQTGTGTMSLSQPFESINSVAFAGKTVTYSFYARAGANFSATSNNLTIYLATGTGTDQNQQGAGYTGQALPISSTATLTTTWQRFTYSATLGATITELQPIFSFTPTGTAGANDYFEVTGIQLEVGSSATSYYSNGNTYQAELAACQRYYYVSDKEVIWCGNTTNAVNYYTTASYPVPMRTAPTVTPTDVANSNFGAGAPTATSVGKYTFWAYKGASATGSGSYFQFTYTASAEL